MRRNDVERGICRQAAKSAPRLRQAFETHIVYGAYIQIVCHLFQHRCVKKSHRPIRVSSDDSLGKHSIKMEHWQKTNRPSFAAIFAASTLFLAPVASNRNQSSACHIRPLESCHTKFRKSIQDQVSLRALLLFRRVTQDYCRTLGLPRHSGIFFFPKRCSASCCVIRNQQLYTNALEIPGTITKSTAQSTRFNRIVDWEPARIISVLRGIVVSRPLKLDIVFSSDTVTEL